MVSLVINSLSLWKRTNYTADVQWQLPARETRHPARADSDGQDAGRADVMNTSENLLWLKLNPLLRMFLAKYVCNRVNTRHLSSPSFNTPDTELIFAASW